MGMSYDLVGAALLWNANASVAVVDAVVFVSFRRVTYDGVLEAASCSVPFPDLSLSGLKILAK